VRVEGDETVRGKEGEEAAGGARKGKGVCAACVQRTAVQAAWPREGEGGGATRGRRRRHGRLGEEVVENAQDAFVGKIEQQGCGARGRRGGARIGAHGFDASGAVILCGGKGTSSWTRKRSRLHFLGASKSRLHFLEKGWQCPGAALSIVKVG
jgi:hypothetical protein